jgi:glycosyltransferase involved in cell wall biosynthesis
MRLLYLHQYFKHPQESGGTRSYDLARSFVQNGLTVDVLTATSDDRFRINGGQWQIVNMEGIRIHYIYLAYSNHMSNVERIWAFFRFLWLCTIRCLKLECDVVLATSTPLTIGIPALAKRLFHGVPFVFEVRDVWPEAVAAVGAIRFKWVLWLLERVEWLIYRCAATIVPLSVDMQASICSRFPEFRSKASIVIENISETQRFGCQVYEGKGVLHDVIRNSKRFIVLYAGTFGRVNGLEYLVNLAERVWNIDSEIVFVAVGDGLDKTRLIHLAEEKGVLGRNLFFIDSVAKELLPCLYAEADMGSSFVIDVKPLWANSANKFFDTLAAGKPILINHGGWQSDVITQSECGFVLPPVLDSNSVEAFVRYTKSDEMILQQGQNARRVASSRYSLEVAVQSYLHIFESVFKEK